MQAFALRWLALSVIAGSAPGWAADPHQHGTGYLDIAREGRALSIALRGPGDAFAGFEHAPTSDEERRLMEAARGRLQQAAALLGVFASGCAQEQVTVSVPHSTNVGHEASAESVQRTDSGHHDHRPQHADQGQEKHASHHHHDARESDAHADWSATWTFSCKDAPPIERLQIDLFDAFPKLEVLQVQYISDRGQTSARLTPTHRSFPLPTAP